MAIETGFTGFFHPISAVKGPYLDFQDPTPGNLPNWQKYVLPLDVGYIIPSHGNMFSSRFVKIPNSHFICLALCLPILILNDQMIIPQL